RFIKSLFVEHRGVVVVALDVFRKWLEHTAGGPGCGFESGEPNHIGERIGSSSCEELLFVKRFHDGEIDIRICFLKGKHPGARKRISHLHTESPLNELTGSGATLAGMCD